jgi:Fe-S cluster assembly protein SufD
MPTTRNEEYRFTDVSPLLQQGLAPPTAADGAAAAAALAAGRPLQRAAAATVVLVDGVMHEQASSVDGLPAGVYIGGLGGAPQDVVAFALVGGQPSSISFILPCTMQGTPAST